MRKIKIIWLQVKDNNGDDLDEITWCEDKINDTDLKYELVEDKNK